MSLILLVIHSLSIDSPKPFNCLYKLFIGGIKLQGELFSYVIEKVFPRVKAIIIKQYLYIIELCSMETHINFFFFFAIEKCGTLHNIK